MCKHRRSTPYKPQTQHRICGHPSYKRHSRSFKNICSKYGIQEYFKGNTTIKQILMKPKDQDPKDKKSGVIYSFQCGDIACSEEYIEETSRTLGERCREHLKHPSPIHAHIQQTGHTKQATTSTLLAGRTRG